MSDPITALTEATDDLVGMAGMILERQPALRSEIEARMAEVAAQMEATFKPWEDFAEGRISEEEFLTILEERAAEDERRRLALHGEGEEDDDGQRWWEPQCETCANTVTMDELPPLYFQCEECQAEEEDE